MTLKTYILITEILCLYRPSARTFIVFTEGSVHITLHFTVTAEAISNKLRLKPSYAMDIRQAKALVNRHSSRNVSQDIITILIF